jgi:chromosome segregation ATPase
MSDDLSDEAFLEWFDKAGMSGDPSNASKFKVWQECRRRAEAQIEQYREERQHLEAELSNAFKVIENVLIVKAQHLAQIEEIKETIEGLRENLNHYKSSSAQWMQAFQKLNTEIEQRQREAFYWAYNLNSDAEFLNHADYVLQQDEAFRAWREGRKK